MFRFHYRQRSRNFTRYIEFWEGTTSVRKFRELVKQNLNLSGRGRGRGKKERDSGAQRRHHDDDEDQDHDDIVEIWEHGKKMEDGDIVNSGHIVEVRRLPAPPTKRIEAVRRLLTQHWRTDSSQLKQELYKLTTDVLTGATPPPGVLTGATPPPPPPLRIRAALPEIEVEEEEPIRKRRSWGRKSLTLVSLTT